MVGPAHPLGWGGSPVPAGPAVPDPAPPWQRLVRVGSAAGESVMQLSVGRAAARGDGAEKMTQM